MNKGILTQELLLLHLSIILVILYSETLQVTKTIDILDKAHYFKVMGLITKALRSLLLQLFTAR